MKVKQKQKRINYIDIAKGIAILFMIIGHVTQRGWKRNVIFSFHMPLFIICSGIFYKKDRTFKEEMIKIIKKLILPYCFYLFLDTFIRCTINAGFDFNIMKKIIVEFSKSLIMSYTYKGNLNIYNNITPAGVLWFVPMLAVIRLVFYGIKKFTKENEILLCLVNILISFIGYILGINTYFLPFNIDIAFFSIIFYYFGYLMKKYQLMEKFHWKELSVITIIWIIGIKFACIELALRKYPTFSVITAICGNLVVLNICKILSNWFNFKAFTWAGQNSFKILGAHQFDWRIIEKVIPFTKLSKNYTLNKIEYSCIRIIFCVTFAYVLVLIEKILKKIVYKKKHKCLYQ